MTGWVPMLLVWLAGFVLGIFTTLTFLAIVLDRDGWE